MGLSDPSVLLATVVQSGAALVGIVGGLVGSRYVALDAEQQAAKRRVEAARGLLVHARKDRDDALDAWIEFQVADVMDDEEVYEEIRRADGFADLDDVLTAVGINDEGIPREALEARLELIETEIFEAGRVLGSRVPLAEEHDIWASFRREEQLQPGHDGVWEWAYEGLVEIRRDEANALRKQREREARAQAKTTMDLLRLGAFDRDAISSYVTSGTLAAPSPGNAGWRTAEVNRLLGDRDETARTVLRLEAEEAAALEHAEAARQPEGFKLTLWVLAVLSLTTMAYPTGLIAWGPEHTGTGWLSSVAVLFMLGVALLMRYLFVYASVLSTHAARRRMPKTPFGLLVPYRLTRDARADRAS